MFRIITCDPDPTGKRIYDAYQKRYYQSHFIFLTDSADVSGDTLAQHRIDSLTGKPDKSANDLYLLASAYSETGRYDSALFYFDKTLAADKNFIPGYFGRATAHILFLEQLQRLVPEEELVTIGTGNPQKKRTYADEPLHSLEEVYEDLSKVIRLDPGFPYAWYNRGYVAAKMGRYSDAIDDLSMAVKLDPSMAGAWYGRGLLNILLRNDQQGCEDLSKAGESGISDAFRVMKRYCYRN